MSIDYARRAGALAARLQWTRYEGAVALYEQRRAILMAVARWLEDSAEIVEDATATDMLNELSDMATAATHGEPSTLDAHGLPAASPCPSLADYPLDIWGESEERTNAERDQLGPGRVKTETWRT